MPLSSFRSWLVKKASEVFLLPAMSVLTLLHGDEMFLLWDIFERDARGKVRSERELKIARMCQNVSTLRSFASPFGKSTRKLPRAESEWMIESLTPDYSVHSFLQAISPLCVHLEASRSARQWLQRSFLALSSRRSIPFPAHTIWAIMLLDSARCARA